jgi:hypothetical protein
VGTPKKIEKIPDLGAKAERAKNYTEFATKTPWTGKVFPPKDKSRQNKISYKKNLGFRFEDSDFFRNVFFEKKRSSYVSEMDKVSRLFGSGLSGGFEIHKRLLFRKSP